ncbi:MAG: glycosyl hydrolase-related protein, partial [Planctomycetota bacterium]|nr:glycosyl hydrolase-related protein [Planctomycetota bacterium]
FCEKTGLKDWLHVYGVGDHGGGPTRQDIMRCIDMNSWPIYPNFKMTTVNKYFETIEKYGDKFPVIKGELNFEFTGCYTSQSQIKKLNRLAECQIQDAENASVLASTMVGKKVPDDKLREAWINTLFGHFHDILPGSGVHWTREYQSGLFQQSAAITGMVTTNSLRAVAAEVDTSFAGLVKTDTNDKQPSTGMGAGAGCGTVLGYASSVSQANGYPHAVVVFNPVVCRRNELVKVSIWEAVDDSDKTDDKKFAVRTPPGKIINAQKVGSGNYWGHNYIDVVFPASVDALGYSTYIIEKSTKQDGNDGTVKSFGSYGIENEFLKIDFDPSTGAVTELIDKTSGVNLAGKDKPFAAIEYLIEKHCEMSAWTMCETIKRISPLNLVSLTRKQQGQFIASIESVMKLNDSTITVTYSLGSGQSWLEIAVKANWLERGSQEIGTPKLRIQFPFALKNAKATYEIPFGAIERNLNQGQEVPAINWADVTGSVKDSNEAAGCLLLNDCKNGHSLDGSTLSLTLLRSSYMPDPLPEMGEHTMRMALVPHNGKISIDKMIRLGTIFNHPLQVINTDIHKGRFPAKTGDLVSVSAENVLIAALKKSEDGSGIILRLLETAGKDTSAIVVLDKSVFGNIEQAVQTDLLERPLTASVEMTLNSFTVNIPANGIATVKVNFN